METLARVSGAIAITCLLAMVLVLGATLLGRPIGWLVPSSEEIVTFLMVGMAFFGIVSTYAKGAHVRVDSLHRRLPTTLRKVVDVASHAGAGGLCVTLAWHSGSLAWTAYRFNDLSDGLIPIPMWVPMGTLPAGFALLALLLLRDAARAVTGEGPAFGSSEKDDAIALARQAQREERPT